MEPPCPHHGTADRYLLGELAERERDAFEAHYFECEACGEEIRAAHALVEGARAHAAARAAAPAGVAWWRRFLAGGWPAGARLAGACAALLLVTTGYQGLVSIPRLEGEIALRDQPRPVSPTALRPALRGGEAAGPTVRVAPGEPYAVLAILPEGPEARAYRARLLTAAGAEVLPPFEIPARDPLYLQLPVRGLAPGVYLLELDPQIAGNSSPPQRYRFILEQGR